MSAAVVAAAVVGFVCGFCVAMMGLILYAMTRGDQWPM